MKTLFIAIALGLFTGWIFSQTILRKTGESGTASSANDSRREPIRRLTTTGKTGFRFGHQWQPQARDGKTYSPYRDTLAAKGRVAKLSHDQLLEAIRAGLFTDSNELGEAIGLIAETDPILALELHDELHSRTDRDAARGRIISAWTRNDPLGLLDYVKGLERNSHRAHMVREFAFSWAVQDIEAAMAELGELEAIAGIFKKGLADSMLRGWGEADYEAAERWIEEHAEPERREALMEGLLAGHVRNLQGKAAVDFVLEHPDNPAIQNLLTEGFQNWAMHDPAAAIERFVTMPEGHPVLREAEALGGAALMSMYMQKHDTSEILTLQEHFPEGKLRRQFMLGAAHNACANNVHEAREIIDVIPESEERIEAIGHLTESWMRRDPVGLSEWLTELDPSPSRDRAVGDFALLLAKTDMTRAQQWASTITDESDRERILGMLPNQ